MDYINDPSLDLAIYKLLSAYRLNLKLTNDYEINWNIEIKMLKVPPTSLNS